ncbi:MAG: MBL fold metallo-hydrolase [Oscillospiraceae bacterium]|nr:MBL fold metallo-hydrolase [Oscillospiraceae bacterium]
MRTGDSAKRLLRAILSGLGLAALSLFLLYTVLWRAKPLPENVQALHERFLSSDFSVCILDIGQADCSLIRQGEHVMLIDCGDPDDADRILETLRALKIKRIDALILTHPHSDHIGSAQAIAEAIPVSAVYMPDAPSDSKILENLLACIEERKIPNNTAYAGLSIPFGDCTVRVLSPQKGLDSPSLNAYSLVLSIEYDGIRLLFTGDAEKENEAYILESGASVSCDLIKVGHHGSESSSDPAFVKACAPRYAVVTTEYFSSNDLPKESVLARWKDSGACVLCTHLCGAVFAFAEDGGLSVSWTEETYPRN